MTFFYFFTCAISGPDHRGRLPDGDGAHKQAGGAAVHRGRSATTSRHMEETWRRIGGKRPEVKPRVTEQ